MLNTTDFLHEMHARGASRIHCVRFRNNRSTIWSLTQRGTVMNVHAAYAAATPELLDAFAVVAIEGGAGSVAARKASTLIADWSPLRDAIEELRRQHDDESRGDDGPSHCCATPEQRAYLKALYRYFNSTRFGGRLPDDIPVRLSSRMRSSLGHMRPGRSKDDERRVAEIALNVDLMLAGNGAERADTLLHEMAHVADYLLSGGEGHGATWRRWAKKVGCRPAPLYDRPVRYRKRRRETVTRVPPTPRAIRELVADRVPPSRRDP